MNPFVIAIDGFASCGKSTLARDLADRLQIKHIDSGAMYRSITWLMLKKDIPFEEENAIRRELADVQIDFRFSGWGSELVLNSKLLKGELRTPEVDKNVSLVASLPFVRDALVRIQREIGNKERIVMDGRDIGSVVFPDAPLKLFVKADVSVRIERRYRELVEKGISVERDQIESNLIERDQKDTTREHSPLVQVRDAVVIDNTNLNREEQLEMTAALAKCRLSKH